MREQHVYLLLTALPDSTCAAWAMAAAPGPSLAEAAADGAEAPGAKLGELLELLKPLRCAQLYCVGLRGHDSSISYTGGPT